jgi:hypothetical protein
MAADAALKLDEKHGGGGDRSAAGGSTLLKGGRWDAHGGRGPGHRAMHGAERGQERGGPGTAGTAQRRDGIAALQRRDARDADGRD